MSYTKHTWVDGELVTAAKMNNIENGIEEASSGGSGGGVLVVTVTDGTLDKTWQEIHDAMLSGGAVIQHQANETKVDIVSGTEAGKGTYFVSCASGDMYSASSASGYPASH